MHDSRSAARAASASSARRIVAGIAPISRPDCADSAGASVARRATASDRATAAATTTTTSSSSSTLSRCACHAAAS